MAATTVRGPASMLTVRNPVPTITDKSSTREIRRKVPGAEFCILRHLCRKKKKNFGRREVAGGGGGGA